MTDSYSIIEQLQIDNTTTHKQNKQKENTNENTLLQQHNQQTLQINKLTTQHTNKGNTCK